MSQVLPHAHGGPPLLAELRREPGDFRVEEVLGFEPDGSGEHVLVWIEKTGANTDWVARQFARKLGLPPIAIGYAGLKDRHAITRQYLSVQLGRRAEPDWQALDIEGVRVLAATRHARKLKRGAHRANRFLIRLRALRGERERAQVVLDAIAAHGVPNYFGEQRFGHEAGNVDLARRLFAGARLPREQRGIVLSAARSQLFNAVLAQRVRAANWGRALDGEVFMLAGSHSLFGPEPPDAALAQRVADHDIHPTGPLWGRGELRSGGAVRAIESACAEAEADLARGLVEAGLEQQRRALRLLPQALHAQWEADELVLAFELETGAFATTVLRELACWQ